MNKFILFFLSLFSISCGKTQIIPVYNGTVGQKYTLQDSLVVDGYFDSFSNTQGDTAVLFLNSKIKSSSVRLAINDVNGNILDYIKCDSIIPQKPIGDSISKNGYSYQYRIKFKINESIKSGIYLISNRIPFLIKNRIKSSKVLVVYPTNTIEAYNGSGGFSFYTLNSFNKHNASILSFHRPVKIDQFSEYFLKKYMNNNYDYISDLELEDYVTIKNYNLIVIIGHSEYWSRSARINFDNFINNNGNALVLSGNSMWWQIRYSEDKTQLICYKENFDPISNYKLKTINWNDKILEYDILPSIGVDFDKGGYGLNLDKGWNGYKILSQNSPLLNGTNLKYGDIVSCPSIEYDGTFVIIDSNFNNIQLDLKKINFFSKVELIAYDFGFRQFNTVGTFIVFQKNINSGYIINTASTDWCSSNGLGGKDGDILKKITDNCIDILTQNKSPFSQ